MFGPDLPWQAAAVLTLGVLLIAAGVIAFLVGLWREDKQHRRALRRHDMSVGRDAFRDVKGVHRP